MSRIPARIAAALCGGYALANLWSLALAGLLARSRAEAVVTALLLSFGIHVAAIVWVFAARSAWRAWAGLLIAAALAGSLLTLQRAVA